MPKHCPEVDEAEEIIQSLPFQHIESGGMHNEVRWDCRRNGSSEPPIVVAPLVDLIRKTLRSKKEVQAMPWSSCGVR